MLCSLRKGVKEVDRSGKEVLYDYENKINMAVFPGLQVDEHDLYLIVYVFISISI